MELAQNGSLSELIKNLMNSNGPSDYTNTTRQIIIAGVARGMKYLHDNRIIHRDLIKSKILSLISIMNKKKKIGYQY